MTFIILGLTWFIIMTSLVFIMLKKSKQTVEITVFAISVLLIVIKTVEFSIHWISGDFTKMPVEFSQISYFLFGFTVIFKLNRVKPYAIFAAFFSGISYMIVFPFFTQYFVSTRGLVTTILALINHTLLYVGGILLMREKVYDKIYVRKIIFYSYIFVLYSLSMRYLLTINDPTLFIYLLLDGGFLDQFSLSEPIRLLLFVIYHLLVFILYSSFVYLYHAIHQKIHKVYFTNLQNSVRLEYLDKF
jgi:hypothetical protein